MRVQFWSDFYQRSDRPVCACVARIENALCSFYGMCVAFALLAFLGAGGTVGLYVAFALVAL